MEVAPDHLPGSCGHQLKTIQLALWKLIDFPKHTHTHTHMHTHPHTATLRYTHTHTHLHTPSSCNICAPLCTLLTFLKMVLKYEQITVWIWMYVYPVRQQQQQHGQQRLQQHVTFTGHSCTHFKWRNKRKIWIIIKFAFSQLIKEIVKYKADII